jgi:hypothetical protein
MKMTIRAALLAGALVIGLAAPAVAAPARPTTSPTATAITTSTTAATTSLANSRVVKWLTDNIAITKMNLSPGMKKFVNMILKAALPLICPLVAKLALAEFQQLVSTGCLGIGTAPDPWEAFKSFTPLLCDFGTQIFPGLAALLPTLCGLLL